MSRPKISTILICVGLFLFFLLLRFPYQNLKGQIFSTVQKNSGIILTGEEIYISLFGWPGLGIKKADVIVPGRDSELNVGAERAVFRVGLRGLFPPRSYATAQFKNLKGQGNLWVRVQDIFGKPDDVTINGFEAEAVTLSQFFPNPADALGGVLNGDGRWTYDINDLTKVSGYGNLSVDKLRTPAQNFQGIVIPSINFGNLKAKLTAKNGSLEIVEFTFGDAQADLSGSITGEIRAGRDIRATGINITLKITPSAKFRENSQAQTIMSILNSIDDSKPATYAMKWNTTVTAIMGNLWNALPKKVSQ